MAVSLCWKCRSAITEGTVSQLWLRIPPKFVRKLSLKAGNPPQLRYQGHVIIVNRPAEEHRHSNEIERLKQSSVLGMDTEARPNFKGPPNPPCLVQLANSELCVLWRLRTQRFVPNEFPTLLSGILTDTAIMKVGHDIQTDATLLLKHYTINSTHLFDTYAYCLQLPDLQQKSLKGLASRLLGKTLTKAQRMSNWEVENLAPAQIAYATADAWASLLVYNELVRYGADAGVPPPHPLTDAQSIVTQKINKLKQPTEELVDSA